MRGNRPDFADSGAAPPAVRVGAGRVKVICIKAGRAARQIKGSQIKSG